MTKVAIIGAGPAGLAAAYALSHDSQIPVVVFEQDPLQVGGIARTANYKGYRFDIGGHRFFSKSQIVENFWSTLLGDELLECKRLSRIYFNGKFFSYPLKPVEAFRVLGFRYSLHCLLSYLWARIRPIKPAVSFEDWVVNHFGAVLYRTFFKTYTEKVWGMSCTEISADWAAQRIKGLSVSRLVRSCVWGSGGIDGDEAVVKTLIDTFRYPRLGPGQLWERVAERVVATGSAVQLDRKVVKIQWQSGKGVTSLVTTDSEGREETALVNELISSMPIRSLIRALRPTPPSAVIAAAEGLSYRDFVIVVLIVNQPELFPDNWIYIHDPKVHVSRIQNFKNWSAALVPDLETSCLGMEYFCFQNDSLWNQTDQQLIELAQKDLQALGLNPDGVVIDGTVVRVPKAYPVYDEAYTNHLAVIRTFIDEHIPNLQLVGRNGMHCYNNQDHSIMTGFLAAKNIVEGKRRYNLWDVNQDAEYHEEMRAGDVTPLGERYVPKKVVNG